MDNKDLMKLLRTTLERLEQAEDIDRDSPTVLELKGSILRTIAALETAKQRKSTSA